MSHGLSVAWLVKHHVCIPTLLTVLRAHLLHTVAIPHECIFPVHASMHAFGGQIPQSLGRLTKLEVLDLSDNCFEGGLPPSMESLTLLNTFSASNNDLSGELPSFVGSLTLLTCLALDGNQFSGSMPREFGKLTLLKRLYLERNELVSLRNGFLQRKHVRFFSMPHVRIHRYLQ